MQQNLVALYGAAGAGKSTMAHTLVDMGYRVVKLAGPLKGMFRALLMNNGLDYHTCERMIEGDLKEVPSDLLGGKTPRHAMQTLGTEWGRDAMDPDFWVRIAVHNITDLLKRGRKVVVDDMRFPNEYAALKKLGAFSVHIYRPLPMQAPNGTAVQWHPSEGALDNAKFDIIIRNDTSLGALEDTTRMVFA